MVNSNDGLDLEPARPHLQRLLSSRAFPKTICPSEVARAMSTAELHMAGASTWRDLMPALRRLAFQLRDGGTVDVLQKGNVLPRTQSLENTTGPIRLRMVQQ